MFVGRMEFVCCVGLPNGMRDAATHHLNLNMLHAWDFVNEPVARVRVFVRHRATRTRCRRNVQLHSCVWRRIEKPPGETEHLPRRRKRKLPGRVQHRYTTCGRVRRALEGKSQSPGPPPPPGPRPSPPVRPLRPGRSGGRRRGRSRPGRRWRSPRR